MRLIDADALRASMYHDAFETDTEFQRWDAGCWIRYKMFENNIDSAPTIQPEREKGNWVGIDDEPCETFECDVCGFTLEDWIQGAFYNFCPNCGADMRGEQDVKVR